MEVKIRHDERRCCKELPVWSGRNFSVPAYIQPISKRVTSVCTPRICNGFDTPLFNVGTKRIPKWVRISKYGEISQSEIPQEFIPQSHNKEDQIVTRQSGIYSLQQRKEFRKFFLIKDARDLVTEEIVYKMFPETAMNTLDDEIALSSFSIHDYVATCLQQVFLPWPLSLLHLLPDWLISSGVG